MVSKITQRQASLAMGSLLSLGTVLVTLPAQAATIDFTTWTTLGDVSATANGSASLSTNALLDDDLGFGSDTDFNFSGTPATDAFDLANFLGIDISELDGVILPGDQAFEGSAIKQQFTVLAGSTFQLNLNFKFLTNEITANEDYAFFYLEDILGLGQSIFNLASASTATLPSSPYALELDQGALSFAFSPAQDTTFMLGFGVLDVNDFTVSSALQLSNGGIVENLADVPEPVSLIALLLTGALSINLKKRG